jgi:hypothetical protein
MLFAGCVADPTDETAGVSESHRALAFCGHQSVFTTCESVAGRGATCERDNGFTGVPAFHTCKDDWVVTSDCSRCCNGNLERGVVPQAGLCYANTCAFMLSGRAHRCFSSDGGFSSGAQCPGTFIITTDCDQCCLI